MGELAGGVGAGVAEDVEEDFSFRFGVRVVREDRILYYRKCRT